MSHFLFSSTLPETWKHGKMDKLAAESLLAQLRGCVFFCLWSVSLLVWGLRNINGLSFMFVILKVDITIDRFDHIISCVNENGRCIALLSTQRRWQRGRLIKFHTKSCLIKLMKFASGVRFTNGLSTGFAKKIRVVINCVTSEWMQVAGGVP